MASNWIGQVFGGSITEKKNKYRVSFLGKKNRYFTKRRYSTMEEAQKHAYKYYSERAEKDKLWRNNYRIIGNKPAPYVEIEISNRIFKILPENLEKLRRDYWILTPYNILSGKYTSTYGENIFSL